jgi:DNA-binding GntR family transcriptional regulator
MKRALKRPPRDGKTPRNGKVLPRNRGALALAHRHILAQVAAGSLPAGTALSEVALAEQLGVSRTPVREAIGQLVAEGILQKTNRGAVVIEPTRQDIIELYELREALEVYSVGKVASTRLGVRLFETLDALVEEVREAAAALEQSGQAALDGEALQKFIHGDLRFHTLLLQAGGNQRMLKILDSTRLLLRVFALRRRQHTAKLLNEIYHFHRTILDAVAAGQREQAMRLLGEHIRLSLEERLAEYLAPELNEYIPTAGSHAQ